ncbi:hypothetical protein LOK49_LG13G00863 [Camellia lanceoleosa]|uniref:Uncharacterized protein n=1 Tax=Camellia lanceoleosa TaxID=1840588 RepID=A0ACC0FMH8_9ERIC|nr:hypothetical protein LOK49_LG13G00863 [Camellia lanceoleosa]
MVVGTNFVVVLGPACCGLRTCLLWSLDLPDLIANECTTYDLMQNLYTNMKSNMSMYLNLFLIGNLKCIRPYF